MCSAQVYLSCFPTACQPREVLVTLPLRFLERCLGPGQLSVGLIPVANDLLSMDHEPTVNLAESIEKKGALRFIYRQGSESHNRYEHAQATRGCDPAEDFGHWQL